MSKNLLIGLVTALVVMGGAAFYFSNSNDTAQTPQTGTATTSSSSTSQTSSSDTAQSGQNSNSSSITMTDVAKHNSESSCWSVIDGNVYDLTPWVSQHPGGAQAILSICGIDGSDAFHAQHDHQPRQEQILATMKIGTLAQ